MGCCGTMSSTCAFVVAFNGLAGDLFITLLMVIGWDGRVGI